MKETYAKLEQKGNLWCTFAELEIVVKDIESLIGFCIDYMPSSIEIIKPQEIIFKNTSMSSFLNDLQAKLHNLDMIVKKLRVEGDILKRNLNAALKNSIMIALAQKKLKKDDLSKITGIAKEEIESFLGNLEKENKIKKEEDIYYLVKDDKFKTSR